MCAIVGALLGNANREDLKTINGILNHIIRASQERGRDGWGYRRNVDNNLETPVRAIPSNGELRRLPKDVFDRPFHTATFVMNLRAEPTTEFVKNKNEFDQQPYCVKPFNIVHNGTIANDKARRTYRLPTSIDSAAIPEILNTWMGEEDLNDLTPEERLTQFSKGIHTLEGSWAVLASRMNSPDEIYAAVNYRPIWAITTRFGWFFASSRDYFPDGFVPEMLPAYSQHLFGVDGTHPYHLTLKDAFGPPLMTRALVVCSGGLDSTVAACMMIEEGFDVELIHFEYGSRAQGPEVKAIHAIAERLGVPATVFPLPVYKPSDSPLLRADSTIAGGEAGAEFAHEWVPARNLLLLSVATAYAEANGFGYIVLGNNLEEAGAYPDNEPEFIHRFNDVLPFAVGANKFVRVIMPVGNMMKHEIVKEGLRINAPLDLTWSCYRAGEKHCGTCGPCFMRKTAFEINGKQEVIKYANEEST